MEQLYFLKGDIYIYGDKKIVGVLVGITTKKISPIIDICEKNNMDIVLETFTKSNVPIYEHFGFELVETHTSDEVSLSEYCMLKRNR